uniref:Uncharacterized protein n=1 Tax=Nelumbo nucifera TaxID=4432 RepID=A0A822ZG65_NELNU|nr:TPA_asm: hypothetical protein HUJ06_000911 [Nelumbo nucifera]
MPLYNMNAIAENLNTKLRDINIRKSFLESRVPTSEHHETNKKKLSALSHTQTKKNRGEVGIDRMVCTQSLNTHHH